MSQPYVGQVIAVGFNFAPINWALCNGQVLPISQYQELYAVIGTTYGGDGLNTFALPDLRGRVVVGAGQGPGLQTYVQGQMAGTEEVTLNANQIAAHSHALMATTAAGLVATPGTTVVPGATSAGDDVYSNAGASTTLAPGAVSVAPGGGLPHENRQPHNVVNYIIALYGIFPSQA
jgi:microcystin-dependent protein